MSYGTSKLHFALAAGVCSLIAAAPLSAQAWNYPSFQPPTISPRIFSVALGTGGDYGTTIFGKWQEGLGGNLGVSAELGFADPDFADDARLFFGGGAMLRVLRSTVDLPIDLALTGGGYLSFGDDATIFRLPFGATLGHRFPLERQLAITPYIHPRLSLDLCTGDACGEDDSSLGLNFDLGGEFEFTRQLAGRLSLVFGDVLDLDNEVGLAFGLAWRPPQLGTR
jgi:hypothetical protein